MSSTKGKKFPTGNIGGKKNRPTKKADQGSWKKRAQISKEDHQVLKVNGQSFEVSKEQDLLTGFNFPLGSLNRGEILFGGVDHPFD